MTVRANVGLTYWVNGVKTRAEAGAVVRDIPEGSLPWLLQQELVTQIEEAETDGEARE